MEHLERIEQINKSKWPNLCQKLQPAIWHKRKQIDEDCQAFKPTHVAPHKNETLQGDCFAYSI